MTPTELSPDLDRETEKIKEPAKRWRNMGLVTADRHCECPICGTKRTIAHGTLYTGCCRTWPSYDAALSFANEHPTPDVIYLGPTPDADANPLS